MDALKLLKQDHADVKALFKDYENLGGRAFAGKKKLVDKICLELTKHATIEEEIFYPALRAAAPDSEDQLDEAEVEHASVKALVSQLTQMDPHDDLYDAKVKVLGEYVNHHVKEEESEMFTKARQSGLDLTAIGQQMGARKDEVEVVPVDGSMMSGGSATDQRSAGR
ncbi:hemerythrin domain-containing protein [Pseudoduganella violaceinigra]|uniref:hemerythrin domain-containing protein n=1 Tax=Pseudoduganella violaceinigra TaxID=246602 RepID=UPI0003FFEFEC|nr:hemerythrin domain-containing protein [Pseudoduganella violaceinigra]